MKNALKATALALFAAGIVAGTAVAGPAPQTAAGDALDPRTYDPGSKLELVAHATGLQKYACQADGTWLFTDPEATLFKTTGAPKEMGSHFLNFATGRPVWMLNDGSSVEAARKAAAGGGAGNIPLLLLQAVVNSGDRLGEMTYVQRLNTSGGIAPAGTCTPGDHAAVSYSADYFFWTSGE